MKFKSEEVHGSWAPFFLLHRDRIDRILDGLENQNFTPARENILRAFLTPLPDVRVVIFGQDPYPGVDVADGLAFSSAGHNRIPASLRNIFKEYASDLGLTEPTTPDISPWSARGVMLLNRSLTTIVGERNSHLSSEWKIFTRDTAEYLGRQGVIAILWGAYAKELAPLFNDYVASPHPSPLSAHRGFFGSKPFSSTNSLLESKGFKPINWQL